MELYQLRDLVAVAEEGQLTRAAERLHLTQPAVTGQIKALEDEFEVALFERTPTGMVPTAAGQRLLPLAEAVLEAAQALRNEARAMRGEVSGKVILGTVSDAEFIRAGPFLNRMAERFPLIEVELQQQVSGLALEHVREGDLDASFYYGEPDQPAVAGLRLGDIVYLVTAPAAWKDQVEGAPWSEIAALPWILPPAVSSLSVLADHLFRRQDVGPVKVVRADQEAVINRLVAAGVGVSLMREDHALAAVEAGEAVVWEGARQRTSLWFIHPANRATDPLIGAMIAVLREIWEIDPEPHGKRKAASRQGSRGMAKKEEAND